MLYDDLFDEDLTFKLRIINETIIINIIESYAIRTIKILNTWKELNFDIIFIIKSVGIEIDVYIDTYTYVRTYVHMYAFTSGSPYLSLSLSLNFRVIDRLSDPNLQRFYLQSLRNSMAGNTTDACETRDPCQHGGICISTDSGPICECRSGDYEGAYCEKGEFFSIFSLFFFHIGGDGGGEG